MKLVRGAWKLLVGIKDALVLVAMLLFFAVIFAALNARQRPAAIGDGALVLKFDGPIVEQPEEVPLTAIVSGQQIPQITFILVGIGLMLLVIFRPQGILGNKKELRFGD